LRQVRDLLAGNPGSRRVQLVFERASGVPLRVDVGDELRIKLTSELEAKLAPWLAAESESFASTMVAVG